MKRRGEFVFDWILDFLFPPACPVCGRYIEQRDCWCSDCLKKLVQPRRLPLDAEMNSFLDGGVWALGVYEAGLRDVLRRLKYDGRKNLLGGLHSFIGAGLARVPSLPAPAGPASGGGAGGSYAFTGMENAPVAVPVPLHPDRLKERGFNQSELLFREPFAALGVPMVPALMRVRPTAPQFGLTAAERSRNMQGAFAVAAGTDLSGRMVIIVDDIMTTGATLSECARAVRAAGAAGIMGIVAASGRK
ncbi:ComF family protein [Anaerovibrio sp.]|uniref:ComF family protein n=1 Tax=Anaerovibrio sp. TaxID=1872532 RepID=UPI003F16B475